MTLTLRPLLLRGVSVAWLTVVWMALWGDLTVGTASAGGLLSLLLVTAAARTSGRPAASAGCVVRPVAALRLAALFAGMLVRSTAGVVRLVLTRRLQLQSAVVTVVLPCASTGVVTVVANAVTLTPGTLTLDADTRPDGSTLLWVHALHAPDAAVVREDVLRLFDLTLAAFGKPDSLSATARTTS